MTGDYTSRGVRVPSGRLARAVRLGGLTTGLLGSAAVEGTRRLAAGQRPSGKDLMLTPANARRLTDQLSRMRGAAMKLGQLVSMEAGDLLPPDLAEILAHLRADAHYMPPRQLKQVLIANYGSAFLTRFGRFDVRPVAAASIGQVHRATTRDGRTLALKIQYPGVRAAIDADIANVGALLRLSGMLPRGIDIAPLLDEARRQLHEEADYDREAAQLRRFGTLIGGVTGFRVPDHHPDFSTPDILAMSFEPGAPIESLEAADQATRDAVAHRLIALFLRELFEWRLVQTDPNFANYLWDEERRRIVLLDFGAARAVPDPLAERFRDLLRAGLAADRAAIDKALDAIGYFGTDTPPAQRALILDMAEMALPVLCGDGPFDFGDPGFATRLRDAALRLGLDDGHVRLPPIDALYLQRRMAGLFLLVTRLKARVAVRPLAKLHAAAP